MNPAVLAGLGKLDRRVLRLVLGAALLLAALEAWQAVLRVPANEYLALCRAQREAQGALAGIGHLPDDLARLRADVGQLETRLVSGPGSDLSGGTQPAWLMGELDRLARASQVRLVAVRPGAEGRVQGFASSSEDIEARGRYRELVDWVLRVEQQLGPLVVSRLRIAGRGDDNPELALQLSLTAYRSTGASGGTP